MRHLRQRGLTLIELMVALAIGVMLMFAAAPMFSDMVANARLREAGNVIYTQALYAQSEALKRNGTVQLSIEGGTITIIDQSGSADTTLRTVELAGGVTASEDKAVSFSSSGMAGSDVSIDLAMPDQTCSGELRCPGLRVEGGGAIRLCGDHTGTC
jgi:type IV fimbrial biogenesis protein FimT